MQRSIFNETRQHLCWWLDIHLILTIDLTLTSHSPINEIGTKYSQGIRLFKRISKSKLFCIEADKKSTCLIFFLWHNASQRLLLLRFYYIQEKCHFFALIIFNPYLQQCHNQHRIYVASIIWLSTNISRGGVGSST